MSFILTIIVIVAVGFLVAAITNEIFYVSKIQKHPYGSLIAGIMIGHSAFHDWYMIVFGGLLGLCGWFLYCYYERNYY